MDELRKSNFKEYDKYVQALKIQEYNNEIEREEIRNEEIEMDEVISIRQSRLNSLLLSYDEEDEDEEDEEVSDEMTAEDFFALGVMFYDADGVEQDFVVSAEWFQMAAEQGHPKAQHNLASMYQNGEGVIRDCSQAASWYRLAANQGNSGSQNNLGSLYETGDGVPQNYALALEWYRQAAEGGDTNAPTNFKRLKPRVELDRYQNIVFAFTDLVAANSPLIGDCSLLPHPKATILYAIKFVVDDYETKREEATDSALIESYEKMIPTLNYVFTCLARDWQDIAPEDKDAVSRLSGYDSFPEWALPLERKYIDEERARKEAVNAASQVLIDKVEREEADEN